MITMNAIPLPVVPVIAWQDNLRMMFLRRAIHARSYELSTSLPEMKNKACVFPTGGLHGPGKKSLNFFAVNQFTAGIFFSCSPVGI
jgi:hypothetical protein